MGTLTQLDHHRSVRQTRENASAAGITRLVFIVKSVRKVTSKIQKEGTAPGKVMLLHSIDLNILSES